ncbi:hypothetical protein D3C73_1466960 [compost metagenome]
MRHPDAHIPLGEDHPVHPKPLQRAAVQNADRLGHHHLDAKLLEQNGGQDAALHIVADRHNAAVQIADAE